MENKPLNADKLKELIEQGKEKYKRAIANNAKLEETKAIYLKIKTLEKKLNN